MICHTYEYGSRTVHNRSSFGLDEHRGLKNHNQTAAMASQTSKAQPATLPSQRRLSSPSVCPSSLQRRITPIRHAASDDSQTITVNKTTQIESSYPSSDLRQNQTSLFPSSPEPRKCWICLADETEDTPVSSAWRSPCPCAFKAHEACLLDWVADLEGSNSKRRDGQKSTIRCPHCTHEIIIARPPRAWVISSVKAAEAAAERFVYPMILVSLAGGLLSGCWLHGYSTLYILFGGEEAERIIVGFLPETGISGNIILPAIPIFLVLSRTRLADKILPFLPFLLLGLITPNSYDSIDTFWPPSVGMTLITLPYLQALYKQFHSRVIAPREAAWLKEIQPRGGEQGEESTSNANVVADESNPRNGIFDVEMAPIDSLANEEVLPRPETSTSGAENRERDQSQPAAPPLAAGGQRVSEIRVNVLEIVYKVVGSLVFPTISASVGALLLLCLPPSWCKPPLLGRPTGLLQTRFGRSLVGGMLFVGIKDAMIFYSRYKLAREHRDRRVLDWNGTG